MKLPRHVAAVMLSLVAAGCGPWLRPVRLSAPVSVSDGELVVQVERLQLTDDLIFEGVTEDTALVVELSLTNATARPFTLSTASLSCWMALDVARPGDTLSLSPAAGGEGPFPGDVELEDAGLAAVAVPPGQTRQAWVVFRGYRYAGSDVPRRITLLVPAVRGQRMELVLADPARGTLRWNVPARTSGWMLGLQNTALGGNHLNGTAMSSQITRVARAGPLLWDISLASTLLVQSHGDLKSPTSSFVASGLNAHLTAPLLSWGPEQDPRQLGVYGGGQAHLLVAIDAQRAEGDTTPPQTYGALAAELGLELDIGALRPARSPFPLSAPGRAVPRWFLRAGYVHWWAGGGGSDGYTTGFRLAW